MDEIEIEGQYRTIGIMEMTLVVIIFIACNIFFLFYTKYVFWTILFAISEVIAFFLIFRFRNHKVYYLTYIYFRPLFRESVIRISDDYITMKVQDVPYFFIFWKDVDTIEIKYTKLPYFYWKRLLRFITHEALITFTKGNNRSILKLSSFNYNKKKYNRVVSVLKERAKFLAKPISINEF